MVGRVVEPLLGAEPDRVLGRPCTVGFVGADVFRGAVIVFFLGDPSVTDRFPDAALGESSSVFALLLLRDLVFGYAIDTSSSKGGKLVFRCTGAFRSI